MKSDTYYMNLALEEARKAVEEDEVPVGAVLVINDEVVASSHNQKEAKKDVTSHAEIEVIREANRLKNTYILNQATLYVTLEPCLMCTGAIKDARIKRIVFGAYDKDKGAITSNFHVYDDPLLGETPLITGGVLEEECRLLLQEFFKKKR